MKQQTLILGGVLLLLTMGLAFQVPARFSGKDFAQPAGRLQGHWVMKTAQGMILETWDVPSAVAMRGRSLTINGPDSSLTEEMVLQYDQAAISYRARVPEQNEGQAVPFALVSADSGRYVSENLNHDFPQRIIFSQHSRKPHAGSRFTCLFLKCISFRHKNQNREHVPHFHTLHI